jgi:putative endonuclease
MDFVYNIEIVNLDLWNPLIYQRDLIIIKMCLMVFATTEKRGEKMRHDRQKLGRWGEDKACSYFISNGYKILQRNYRCRFGEIDMIVQKADQLIFAEVKTRTSTVYGYPSEAVNHRKQLKYEKSALCFLKETGWKQASYRFDIIEVMVHYNNTFSINHIENAFSAGTGRYYY